MLIIIQIKKWLQVGSKAQEHFIWNVIEKKEYSLRSEKSSKKLEIFVTTVLESLSCAEDCETYPWQLWSKKSSLKKVNEEWRFAKQVVFSYFFPQLKSKFQAMNELLWSNCTFLKSRVVWKICLLQDSLHVFVCRYLTVSVWQPMIE